MAPSQAHHGVTGQQYAIVAACFVAAAALSVVLQRRARRAAQPATPEVARTGPPTQPGLDPFVKRQDIFRALSHDMEALFDNRLEVRHMMSTKLKTVPPDAPAAKLKEMMRKHHLRHLLVANGSGDLLGIISDRDFAKGTAGTATDVMTADPITVAPTTPLMSTITLLVKKRISCVPVVGEGKLLGVLTTTDLMMTLQCALKLLQRVAATVQPEETPSGGDVQGPGAIETCEAHPGDATEPEYELAGSLGDR